MAEPQIKGTTQPRLWLEVALLGLLQPASLSNGVVTQNTAVSHGTPVASPRPTYEPPKSPPMADVQIPKPDEQSGIHETQKPNELPSLPPQNQLPPQAHPPAQSPPPPIQPPSIPSLPPEPAPSGGLRERWEEWIRSLDPPTQGLMRIAFLIHETPKEIVLGFPTETFVKKSNEPKRLKNVQDNLHRLLGRPVLVKFAVGKGKSPTATPPGQDSPQTSNPSPPTQNFQSPPPPPQNLPPTQNFQPPTQNPSPPNQGFQPPQNFQPQQNSQPPSPPPPPQNFQPPPSPPIPPAQNFQPPPPPPQHFQSPPPAQNVPPPPSPAPNERQPIADPDELERTTKGLADFFNGQVIHWDHEVAPTADNSGSPTPPPTELPEEEDDDFLF